MAQEKYSQRSFFGGAISSLFPDRFQDVSNVRQVSDHQEAFVDPVRDESLIVELFDFKPEIGDNGSATWFLQYLATEQEAEGSLVNGSRLLRLRIEVIEQSGVVEVPGLSYGNVPDERTRRL